MNSVPEWNPFLLALLSSRRPQIDRAFEDLLDREINITAGIRAKASDSQNHLRDFLRQENSRDPSFPKVLSKTDADFLGGSFSRHTKNWPLDDIDIYLPLEGANLFYLQNGQRLPYVVQSDGPLIWNPLLGNRWTSGAYVSSWKLISEFALVLRRHYPHETEVRGNGECVSVRMTHGESSREDGLGYDVVPCFSLKPDASNEFEFYLIPDGNGGWIRTNPKLDRDLCEILHEFHGKIYRKVVKLVKYWNATRLGASFSSYYIEHAISSEFWTRKRGSQRVTTISEGLSVAFAALEQAFLAGNQTGWISGAPAIERPVLTRLQSLTLSSARAVSGLAFLNETSGKRTEAFSGWLSVFGDKLRDV